MSLKAFICADIVRTIGRSLRYRFVFDDPSVIPHKLATPAIYIFWHEMLIMPTYTHCRQISPLISRSRDGNLIAEVVQRLGGKAIRGSTDHHGKNRGGRSALREMLRLGQHAHMAVPIDGPVGPRRKTSSPGVAWVASHARMPIIPVGIGITKFFGLGPDNKRINFPRLWTTAWIVVGRPMHVPSDIGIDGVREFMQQVQIAMDDVQGRAERFVKKTPKDIPSLTLKQLRAV